MEIDLAVIGAGPAGEKAAVRAAYHGKKVVVIDRDAGKGGSCIRGGIPSKVLREVALCYSGARRHLQDFYGEPRPASMDALLRRIRSVCEERIQRVRTNLERHKIDLISGAARFEDEHTLVVGDEKIRARFILIATGSRPVRPESIPFDGRTVHCSDTILNLDHVPQTLTVIGGGAIGSEYASIFCALGSRVTLIEGGPRITNFLDTEMSDALMESFREAGIEIVLETRVTSVESLKADCVLFSGGRRANTDDLQLDRLGIKVDERGRPATEDRRRIAGFKHIFAAGDVLGFPSLASVAMEEGRNAVSDMFGLDDFPMHDVLPYCLYAIPSAAMVGATEQQLVERGVKYVVGRADYADQDRGHIMGDPRGFLKLLCDPDSRRILGVHIVGELAEELIHLGQACLHFGGTLDYFLGSVANFPTLTELYKKAAYSVLSTLQPGSF